MPCFVPQNHVVASILAMFLVLAGAGGDARAELMRPFKDELFAYPKLLASADGGRHLTVDYRIERDLRERDEVPERRVRGRFVDLAPLRAQTDLVLKTDVANVPHVVVGAPETARFIVVYLYGQGGNRNQGMNDHTFGGNFNRLKNLAQRNGGIYITPEFSDFGPRGSRQVASLLSYYSTSAPEVKIYLACGSMGGALCWQLAKDADVAPSLGGLLLLGSHWDESFLASTAFKRRVPVFFGHGSDDRVFPVATQERFFRSILKKAPNYPVRFVRFETGSHGTPIRMVDWRGTLNWMDGVR